MLWRRGLVGLMGMFTLGALLAAALGQESPEALRRRAENLVRLGMERYKRCDAANVLLEEALRLYRQLDARPGIDARPEIADTLQKILRAYGSSNAIPYARDLIALDRSFVRSPRALAEDKRSIGAAFYHVRDFKQAFAYLDQALKLAEALRDPFILARCHDTRGVVHNFRGEIRRAIPHWQEAVRFYREAGDQAAGDKKREAQVGEARARCNLGGWQLESGEHEEALRNLWSALELAEKLDPDLTDFRPWRTNRDTLRDGRATLADLFRRLGQPEKALEWYRQARRISGGYAGDRQQMFLVDMADIYADRGREEDDVRAEGYYELVLLSGGSSPNVGEAWVPLKARSGYSDYLIRKGRPKEALELCEEALKIAQHSSTLDQQADCLLRMGSAYLEKKEPPHALERFQESLKLIQESVPIPDLQWRAHHGKGRALAALGRDREAVVEYEKAIEILNRWLRGVPQSSENPAQTEASLWTPYHDALLAYLQQGRQERAFRLSERAKVGLLTLTAHQSGLNRGMTSQERIREQQLRLRVAEARQAFSSWQVQEVTDPQARQEMNQKFASDLRQAEAQHHDFLQTLYLRHPETQVARGDLKIVGLTEARAVAAATGATLVDYVVTEQAVRAFVIDRHQATVHSLSISPSELERQVKKWVHTYQTNPRGTPVSDPYPPEALQLYKELVRPLEDRLKQAHALCIIPDGVLWSVPFGMLWQEGPGGSGRYLIERFPLSYASSVSALRLLTERARSRRGPAFQRVAALGTPDLGPSGQRGDLLRGEAQGCLAVKELAIFPGLFGQRAEVYAKKRATEKAARGALERCDLVHFGCHGRYNDRYPLYSSLALTPGQGQRSEDDGFLEAREIATLRIKAQLVVLAACDTGRGEVARGQGLIGLTWATFVGGAPACVATHWPVDDDATAQLAKAFYQHLQAGRSQAESLRRAQLSLLRGQKFAHPYYWAGVMLMGK